MSNGVQAEPLSNICITFQIIRAILCSALSNFLWKKLVSVTFSARTVHVILLRCYYVKYYDSFYCFEILNSVLTKTYKVADIFSFKLTDVQDLRRIKVCFKNLICVTLWKDSTADSARILFCEIGFNNEADTLESSSILIYCYLNRSFYTWRYNLI